MAGEPVALVEDLSAERPNLQFMDFLEEGRVIALATRERIVLGYMAACLRETIIGGTITVGSEESFVEGGTIEREEIDCDGGALRLTTAQAQEAGATVFRTKKKGDAKVLPRAQRVLYGVSPMLLLPKGPAKVTITRLDATAKPLTILVENRRHDLAKDGVALAKGGLYAAETGEHRVVFKISAIADSGASILGRLLAF
ncbi:MAG: hypothetical protein VCC99_12580 [Alphaproteobacteria bacterium]